MQREGRKDTLSWTELISSLSNKKVFVTSRGKTKSLHKEQEKDNVCVVNWHTPVANDSCLISLSKNQLTSELIAKSGVFAINIPEKTNLPAEVYCELHSGRFADKFEKTGLKKLEAEKIDAPVLADSLVIECEVRQTIELGDRVVFLGKTVDIQKRGNS